MIIPFVITIVTNITHHHWRHQNQKHNHHSITITMFNSITTTMFNSISTSTIKITSATVFPCFAFTPIDLWLGNSRRKSMRASTRTSFYGTVISSPWWLFGEAGAQMFILSPLCSEEGHSLLRDPKVSPPPDHHHYYYFQYQYFFLSYIIPAISNIRVIFKLSMIGSATATHF